MVIGWRTNLACRISSPGSPGDEMKLATFEGPRTDGVAKEVVVVKTRREVRVWYEAATVETQGVVGLSFPPPTDSSG